MSDTSDQSNAAGRGRVEVNDGLMQYRIVDRGIPGEWKTLAVKGQRVDLRMVPEAIEQRPPANRAAPGT